MQSLSIQFVDLEAQQRRIRERLNSAIAEALDQGAYIMGPQVARFESNLAAFCGAKHAITCANGTDALQLALMALQVRQVDAIFVPSFTFAATAEAVRLAGATPVFVDSDMDSFNMDPLSLERSINRARACGLNPRAVIPVDLFGMPADMESLEAISAHERMELICDSAQGFGGTINGRMTGTFGRITTTSFFPAKPLGCYGDGGALFTADDGLAHLLRSLRVHGKGIDKYENIRVGMNSRLDTIQAAILLIKLEIYEEEINARNEVASRYNERLSNVVEIPAISPGYRSVWAQYTIKLLDGDERHLVQCRLKQSGVPTAIYYPTPLHLQPAYSDALTDPAGLPNAEELSTRVLSLPIHAYLDKGIQHYIVDATIDAVASARHR